MEKYLVLNNIQISGAGVFYKGDIIDGNIYDSVLRHAGEKVAKGNFRPAASERQKSEVKTKKIDSKE